METLSVPHAANTVKRPFSANFILKCTIQFILIKALRVLKSLERRKIPVQNGIQRTY